MMLPPLCFMVWMVFFGLQTKPFFLQTWQWSLQPNRSIFHQTRGQFSRKPECGFFMVILDAVYTCKLLFYRWQWCIQAFDNCSQGRTRFVEFHNFFPKVYGCVLLIFPKCQAASRWVWRWAVNMMFLWNLAPLLFRCCGNITQCCFKINPQVHL